MKLKAHLTVGWDRSEGPRAKGLHDNACENADDSQKHSYGDVLAESTKMITDIYCVDELFNRRVDGGFKPVKVFISALAEIPFDQTITCHIDVFAYAFLKNAKNFDLLMPESDELGPGFRNEYESMWRSKIDQYEQFERSGEEIIEKDKEIYLLLRRIALRKSARDEWRAVATLLWSGPRSTETISKELGLSYDLGVRVLKPFIDIGAVSQGADRFQYRITTEYIPVLLYFLRELLGIDPLKELKK